MQRVYTDQHYYYRQQRFHVEHQTTTGTCFVYVALVHPEVQTSDIKQGYGQTGKRKCAEAEIGSVWCLFTEAFEQGQRDYSIKEWRAGHWEKRDMQKQKDRQ